MTGLSGIYCLLLWVICTLAPLSLNGSAFFTHVQSCVVINGYCSPVFYPTRCVRQGCLLSPLLYVLTREVLAVTLRSHPDIVGLTLPSVQSPSLYTDDTSAIVISDPGIKAVSKTIVLSVLLVLS